MVIQYESLESLCDVIDPHPSHRAPKAESIGIPFLGIGDFDSNGSLNTSKARIVNEKVFDEHKQRYSLQDDLLLFGRVASIGKVVELPKTDKKFVISPTLAVLKPKSIDLRYLKYALQSPEFMCQMEEISTGSTRKSVGMKNLRKAKVPVFPSAEQKSIVAILDQAFSDIDKARDLTEQNHKNARELFESYLQQVFSHRGEVWTTETMEEACELITCGVASTPKYVDESEGVPFLSAQNVKAGKVVLDKFRYISSELHTKLTKKNIPSKGDILYSRVGAGFGEAAVVEHDFEFSVYVSLTLIKPVSHKLNNYYLKYFLNSPQTKSVARASITSSGVPNLNVKAVRKFIVSYPSIEKQKDLVLSIQKIERKSQVLQAIYEKKLDMLDNLKNSILQKAFSGELIKGKQEAA